MASAPCINDDNANVMLVCGNGEIVKAHANVLKCCKYFARKLQSKNIINNTNDITLEIPQEVDPDDLTVFVKSLYDDIVIPEENWATYNELCSTFEYDGSFDNGNSAISDGGNQSGTIDSDAGASGDKTSESESEDSDSTSKGDTDSDVDSVVDSDSAAISSELNANGVIVSAGSGEKPKILIFKELFNELKPSTLQSVFNRIPVFDAAAKDVVIDLMLTEFIRSRNIQVRMAHFELYDKMQRESKCLFENAKLDVKTLLVPKVEYLFAQHVIGRTEDEIPNIAGNGSGALLPLDEQVGRFLQQMRRDVRAHGRAIVCLFGEFYLRDWIADRSVDLAISALLQIGTNEKLEYFCQLIVLIEKHMQEKLKISCESIRLEKYEAQIKEAFSKASPKVKQMFKERNSLEYKIPKYGVDTTAKGEVDNIILDHIYWIRSNIASLNADQYYKQSGGFAVRGLNTPIINYTIEDLKPIVHESATAPKESDNRVKRVPRGEFFRKMRAIRERQTRSGTQRPPDQSKENVPHPGVPLQSVPDGKSNPPKVNNTPSDPLRQNSSKSKRAVRRCRGNKGSQTNNKD